MGLLRSFCLFVCCAAWWPTMAQGAAGFRFETIVDTSDGFLGFVSGPSLNNNGDVVFAAEIVDEDGPGPDLGLYRTVGDTVQQIAFSDGTAPYRELLFAPSPIINDSGDVVFFAIGFLQGDGIFTGPDPTIDVIADEVNSPFLGMGLTPAFNNNGDVLFQSVLAGGVNGLYSGADPIADKFVDNSGPFDRLGTQLDLNDTGGVVFDATLDDGVSGLFTGTDPIADRFVDSTGLFSTTFLSPRMNDSGNILFFAMLDSGVSGLFTGPDPTTDTLVDDSGPFEAIGGGLINNQGDFLFSAVFDAGRIGIFNGPDIVDDRIIATGDALFGSTLTGIGGARVFNDLGQFAFSYTLDNGTSGIAIASPEVPGDANGDGQVDLLDLDILGANFGAIDATIAEGDFNGDNVVDLLDLDILGQNFATAAASRAAPEPANSLLFAITALIAGSTKMRA